MVTMLELRQLVSKKYQVHMKLPCVRPDTRQEVIQFGLMMKKKMLHGLSLTW